MLYSDESVILHDPLYSSLRPLPNIAPVLNVSDNPDLKRRMTKYFYEKTFNKWMYSDFNDILQYLAIRGNKVVPVASKKEYSNNKDTLETLNQKIDFIVDNIFSKYDMKSFLNKLVMKSNIKWFDLKIHRDAVKDAIYKKIRSEVKKLVTQKGGAAAPTSAPPAPSAAPVASPVAPPAHSSAAAAGPVGLVPLQIARSTSNSRSNWIRRFTNMSSPVRKYTLSPAPKQEYIPLFTQNSIILFSEILGHTELGLKYKNDMGLDYVSHELLEFMNNNIFPLLAAVKDPEIDANSGIARGLLALFKFPKKMRNDDELYSQFGPTYNSYIKKIQKLKVNKVGQITSPKYIPLFTPENILLFSHILGHTELRLKYKFALNLDRNVSPEDLELLNNNIFPLLEGGEDPRIAADSDIASYLLALFKIPKKMGKDDELYSQFGPKYNSYIEKIQKLKVKNGQII